MYQELHRWDECIAVAEAKVLVLSSPQWFGRSQARSLRTVHASPGLRAQLRLCRLPRHLFSFFSISKFLHSRTHLGYSIFLLFNFEEPGTPFASHAAGSPHCSQRAHRFISL